VLRLEDLVRRAVAGDDLREDVVVVVRNWGRGEGGEGRRVFCLSVS
jgi:hypothetical protein